MFISRAPERPYAEIGFLHARQESGFSFASRAELIAALRERAALAGCEGLVLTERADVVQGSASGGSGSVVTLEAYTATCIVFTD